MDYPFCGDEPFIANNCSISPSRWIDADGLDGIDDAMFVGGVLLPPGALQSARYCPRNL